MIELKEIYRTPYLDYVYLFNKNLQIKDINDIIYNYIKNLEDEYIHNEYKRYMIMAKKYIKWGPIKRIKYCYHISYSNYRRHLHSIDRNYHYYILKNRPITEDMIDMYGNNFGWDMISGHVRLNDKQIM